jgi:hypothetical protein
MTIIDSHVHLFRREHWDETSARTWLSPFGLDPDIMDVDTDELMEGFSCLQCCPVFENSYTK